MVFSMAATSAAYAFCASAGSSLPGHRLQALRQRAECVGIGGFLDDGNESRVRLLRVGGVRACPEPLSGPPPTRGVCRDWWFSRWRQRAPRTPSARRRVRACPTPPSGPPPASSSAEGSVVFSIALIRKFDACTLWLRVDEEARSVEAAEIIILRNSKSNCQLNNNSFI